MRAHGHQLRLRQQLAGEGTYFVAWSGDEPAGWVFLVFPEHASERAARDAGWDTIGLSVTVSNPDNELARTIYRRRGYRDSGQGEYHDGNHYHDAAGLRRYHGEQHVYRVKRLSGADS